MIDKIKIELPQKRKNIAIIDLLMNFINEEELKLKWKYSLNLYYELEKNLIVYEQNSDNQIIYNYIDNDNHMLNHMIDEFKEDIYPLFSATCFSLINKLTSDDIFAMSRKIDESLMTYSLNYYINNIYILDLNRFKTLAEKLKSYDMSDTNKVFLNYVINLYGLNKKIYLQVEQAFNKIIKELNLIDEFKSELEEYRIHSFVVLVGDKNV